MDAVFSYMKKIIPGINDAWDKEKLSDLALLKTPDMLLSKNHSLFNADIQFLWFSWFIESIYDYHQSPDNIEYPEIISSVRRGLKKSGFDENDENFNKIWIEISKLSFNFILRSRGRYRDRLTKSNKEDLLEKNKKKLSCWICGHKFSKESIEKFQNIDSTLKLPNTVDYYLQKGLKERDLQIEVEHKMPFISGGGDLEDLDNIELSCGFCNRHKWKFISIYDANRSIRTFSHPRIGNISIPQPYWGIRILALSEKCSENGCTAKKNTTQLYIDLINDMGSATPTNLKVVCHKHLKNKGDRFLKSAFFNQKTRNRNSFI